MPGAKVGSFVHLQPMALDCSDIKKAGCDYEVRYRVVLTGSECSCVRPGIQKLTLFLSFDVDAELLSALDAAIGELSDDELEQLYELTVTV